MEIGQLVVFKWLGVEHTGKIWKIDVKENLELFWVEREKIKYPCMKTSKWGIILEDKTIALQQGEYIKEEKTEIDYAMEDIQKSFDKLKELQEDKFPKKKIKELKEIIKNMKKQLSDLQKLIESQKQ